MRAARSAPHGPAPLTSPGFRAYQDVAPAELPGAARALIDHGFRLALVTANEDTDEPSRHRIVYLFTAAAPDRRIELVTRTAPGANSTPSLAEWSFAAGRFEQLLFSAHGIEATSAPTEDPSLAVSGCDPYAPPPHGPFAALPVWPDHAAGCAFPRSNATGSAGSSFERSMRGRQVAAAEARMDTLTAHTRVGHTLAFCLAVEDAYHQHVPARIGAARAILLELERLSNHVTDLGELCRQAGYHLGYDAARQLRHKVLGLNNDVAGHPHLCGTVTTGGVRIRSLPAAPRLWTIATDAVRLVGRALEDRSLRERFTANAILTTSHARTSGALGFVARASGVDIDARRDHPFHPATSSAAPALRHAGDIMARFLARADEIVDSVRLIVLLLDEARPGIALPEPRRAPSGEAVHGIGLVEGWRGTIVHRLEACADGTITDLRIVDPCFLTLPALPLALTSARPGDLPLACASFNAAYTKRTP